MLKNKDILIKDMLFYKLVSRETLQVIKLKVYKVKSNFKNLITLRTL